MTDIRDAITALRASVAALTEGERVQSWWATTDGGDHWWVKAGGCSVANAGLGETAQRAAEHIATVASPDVTEALARHLEAIHRDTAFEDVAHMERWAINVQTTAQAVAAAITRRSTT